MFKIRKIKALQHNTASRNLANEFINEQGSCATLTVAKCAWFSPGSFHYQDVIVRVFV